MSHNESGRDSSTGNRNPESTGNRNPESTGNRNPEKKSKPFNHNDVTYTDRLIRSREKGLPKVGLYEPMDTSRLKPRPNQRPWEKKGRFARIGSGLRRSRPNQRPINTSRSYVPTYVNQEIEPYQLTYLNHSGFIHSVREKRRTASEPPARISPHLETPNRTPTPTPRDRKKPGRDDIGMIHPAEVIAPMKEDHAIVKQKSGIFNYENPYVYEGTHEYRKAREYVPTKSDAPLHPPSLSKEPTQLHSVQNKAPVKPKAPQDDKKEPKNRSKETPHPQHPEDPEEMNPKISEPSPLLPLHMESFHFPNPHSIPTPEHLQSPIHPTVSLPAPIHPQVPTHQLLPHVPSPSPTPRLSPKHDDDPVDFAPNPIYTYPSPSPPPSVQPTLDPTAQPQSKYAPLKQPKTTPSTHPRLNPAPQRRPQPKRAPTRGRPGPISTPTVQPSKPKTHLPRNPNPKKYMPPSPSYTRPETPQFEYAPPSRPKSTAPPYFPPPQTPPTRHLPRNEPRRELTPPLNPESRIPRARLQPSEKEPYRRPPSPRNRPRPPPVQDYEDPGHEDSKDPHGYLPTVYGRNPEAPSHPSSTYYPSTFGLEKERLHSMGTIMRSMAMFRHQGGAGTYSFRT